MRFTIVHVPMSAATTTTISSTCPECGMMKQSGKLSCCGRGGSWFGHCGSVGGVGHVHTFYEGIRVCKERQSQAVAVQHLYASQPKNNIFLNDVRAPSGNGEFVLPARSPMRQSMVSECAELLHVITHVSLILIFA